MRILSLLMAVLVALVSLQPAAQVAPARTLDRDLDPVIVTALPAFNNVALAQLFVYAYQAGTWRQIPLQLDEMQGSKIVASGDGKLGAADQLVFMAADTGDKMSYGDAGAALAHPASHLRAVIDNYVLPPSQPNVGARYLGYAAQPLQTQAVAQSANVRHVYLPQALRLGH
jgi:hypothetical protein